MSPKVIPIYKKDDPEIFGNYLPISIVPAISEIFEKVMFNQLHAHFEVNKLYYNSQYELDATIQLNLLH